MGKYTKYNNFYLDIKSVKKDAISYNQTDKVPILLQGP